MAGLQARHRVLEPLDRPLFRQQQHTRSDEDLGSANGTASSTTSSTSASSDQQATPTVVLRHVCGRPSVSNVGPTAAFFQWSPPEHVFLPGDSQPAFLLKNQLELVLLEGAADSTRVNPAALARVTWARAYEGPGLACKVEGLRPGRLYAARTSALVQLADPEDSCVDVTTEPSAPILIHTPPTAPSHMQPPSLTQRARNALKLKWNLPEEPGGELELTYALEISPPPQDTRPTSSGPAQEFAEVYRGPERMFKVTKLLPGTRYMLRVRAINSFGSGPFSVCSAFSTQATVPAQPTPPEVVSATAASINLQWVPPNDNGSPVCAYRLERDDGKDGEFELVYAGQATNATAEGLQCGTSYRFRLRAENDEGWSAWSVATSASTGARAPEVTAMPQLVSSNKTSCTVAWKPPSDNGGSMVLGYQVELQAKTKAAAAYMGNDWLKIFDGDATACTINSLRAGCTYRVRVRACNAVGWSQWTVPVDIATQSDVPEAPLALQLTETQATSLVLAWAPPRHDGGAPVVAYNLEMASAVCACGSGHCPLPLPPPPSSCNAPTLVYTGEASAAEVFDLEPGTPYYFRVRASNSNGFSTWTDWVPVATAAMVPHQPEPPSVSGISSHTLTLRWPAAVTRGSPTLFYVVEAAQLVPSAVQATAGHAGEQQGQSAAPAPTPAPVFRQMYRGPAEHVELRGLEPNTPYLFRLAAVSELGSSAWSGLAHALTGPTVPTPPEALLADGISCTAVRVSWDAPANDNGARVLQTVVEMCPVNISNMRAGSKPAAAGGLAWQIVYTGAGYTCEVDGLSPGRCYQFRARAANVCGPSSYTAPVQAYTQPAPPSAPQRLAVSQRASNTLKVRWEEPYEDNGASVTAYTLQVRPLENTAADWQMVYNGRDLSAKVSALQPATKYSLRACAANIAGCSPWSEEEYTSTMQLPPGPPTGLTVSEVQMSATGDGASAVVMWTAPEPTHTVAAVMSYEVTLMPIRAAEQSAASGTSASTASGPSAASASSRSGAITLVSKTTEARVSGLALGTTYCVKLRSVGVDATGHSSWSEEAIMTTPPAKPCGPESESSQAVGEMAGGGAAAGTSGGTAGTGAAAGAGGISRKASKRRKAAAAAAASAGHADLADADDTVPGHHHHHHQVVRRAPGEKGRVAAALTPAVAKKRPVAKSPLVSKSVRKLAMLLLVVVALVAVFAMMFL